MTVTLIDKMGDDLAIVDAARVSYAKRSAWGLFCALCDREIAENEGPPVTHNHYDLLETGKVLKLPDKGLINYLLKNRHGTPFEMVQFKFHVNTPIKVAREWQRHRIASYNEVSTRYVEMEPKFYIPELEDVREQVGKSGHYVMQTIEDKIKAKAVQVMMDDAYELIYNTYSVLVQGGVAKELASFLLPMGLMTEFYVSMNLRSLFNFVSLRSHVTALKEIRMEAAQVEDHIKSICPAAYEAFVQNGRVAP